MAEIPAWEQVEIDKTKPTSEAGTRTYVPPSSETMPAFEKQAEEARVQEVKPQEVKPQEVKTQEIKPQVPQPETPYVTEGSFPNMIPVADSYAETHPDSVI